METVEVIVYLLLAFVIGGLIIGFLVGWDVRGTYQDIKGVFGEQDPERYEEISAEEFPRTVLAVWDDCGLGSVERSKTVHITDAVLVDKTALFSRVKAAYLCRSLQSAEEDCGSREDVAFEPVQGPAIVTIRCDPATSSLVISH